ncbi:TonB-dependent receptor [Hymenobacter sp. DG01]|uniref:SusC/RagA family TonB-linked outer membrane protein n=1 Tax=Hymenobacter sp. DG01 TaxID=2584940 RepID=UPI0011236636|nr:TonB-dependent receptor [Hymenobacter sp. DG01]
MQSTIRKSALGLGWPLMLAAGLPLTGALLAPTQVQAQTARTITGRVTDQATGEGIPGVTVLVKGTSAGASTGTDGSFTVQAPAQGNTLVFSAIGYVSVERPIGSNTTFNVTLSTDAKALNEVVVVGYGVQKKSQVTGAISSVDEQSLRDVPVANVGQALQGRAAGVNISSSSNTPGQNPVIRIRGNRSFSGSNDPLLVVDGVPYDGSLNDLNPDDIVSLEVLKDASSTAIYGARGANGVILISTRRGKNGPTRVTYSGYYGVKQAREFDLQNGQEFYDFRLRAYRARNPTFDPVATPTFLTQGERDNLAAGRFTDYQDLLIQKGRLQNHALGMSGGNEQTQYSASLGYYDETGVVPVQQFQRFSLRGTLDQQIGKRVKIGFNTLNTYIQQDDPNLNIINSILTGSPLASPYDANGLPILFPNTDTALPNPLTYYVEDAHKEQNRRLRSFNSLYGQVNILKGLDYRLNVGLDFRSETGGNFFATGTPARGTGVNQAGRSGNTASNILLENLLLYNRTFADKHDVNFTGLYSIQDFRTDNFSATVQDLPTNYQLYNNLGAGKPVTSTSGFSRWDIISYMGRLNYAFDNRYSATVTMRVDGSSRLSPGNKYKAFPSAAVAWNIANEGFIQDQSWVSGLKLRASIGRVGSTAINPYQTLGSLNTGLGNGNYTYGSTGAVGVVPGSIPNNDLGWEYTTTTNFGLDFGFFDNRVSGSVELYQQRTSDLLLPFALPGSSGYTSVLVNAGKTQNRGLEITLSTINMRTGGDRGFEWITDWNFTVNREKVLDLNRYNENGDPIDDLANQRFIGQPLYVIYDYKKTGIWQLGEESQAARYGTLPGQIKFEDVNNDGRIDAADRQIIGSRQPKFEAGLTNRFKYKGFDLTAVALTRVGATIVDPLLFGPSYFTTFDGRRNQINLDYWTPQNPTNNFPQPVQGIGDYQTDSRVLGYVSGTFVKVRSIDLGYALPSSLFSKVKMSTARIYVQVQNPFIWSPVDVYKKNKAIDPDALSYSSRFNNANSSQGGIEFTDGNPSNGNAGVAGRGVSYPATRAFIVGLNLGF